MSPANSHYDSEALNTSTENDASNLVELGEIAVSFDGRHILQDVHLRVRKREIVTLIGPNGAGKTTLVRVVLGLLKPQQGQVNTAPELTIGYMPQKLHLDKTLPLTVERFLKMGLQPSSAPSGAALSELIKVALARFVTR